MEPATLAAGAIALLAAYLTKAGEGFAEEGGKAAWRLAGSLLDRLRLAVKGKPRKQKVLEDFSGDPSEFRSATQEMLREMIEEDPRLGSEVGQILQEVKRLGPSVSVVQQIGEAEEITGATMRSMRTGSVEIDQKIKKGTIVTGLVIGEDMG